MSQEIVWAFEPIEELDGKTGWVEVELKLAQKLIKQGKVQDGRVGATHLKEIITKDIKSAPKKGTSGKRTSKKEE